MSAVVRRQVVGYGSRYASNRLISSPDPTGTRTLVIFAFARIARWYRITASCSDAGSIMLSLTMIAPALSFG